MVGAVTGSVVIGNLAYLIGAVVLMIVISSIVVLRHHRPRSVEANMESFHRGLRALAPEEDEKVDAGGRRGRAKPAPVAQGVPPRHGVPARRSPVRPLPNRPATGGATPDPAAGGGGPAVTAGPGDDVPRTEAHG